MCMPTQPVRPKIRKSRGFRASEGTNPMASSTPPENDLQRANAGDIAAMLRVARFYDTPQKYGNKKDARQAFLWYKKAVETRPSPTMTKLDKEFRVLMMGRMGHFLIAGHGTSKNKAEGMALMARAAELGCASAAFILGKMRSHCTTGSCTRTNTPWEDFKLKRNDEEAIYWLELAVGEHCPITPLLSLCGGDKEAAKRRLETIDPVRRAEAERRRKEADEAEEERRKKEVRTQAAREEERKAEAAKRALLDGVEVAKELTVEEKIKEQMEQVRRRGEEIDLLSP